MNILLNDIESTKLGFFDKWRVQDCMLWIEFEKFGPSCFKNIEDKYLYNFGQSITPELEQLIIKCCCHQILTTAIEIGIEKIFRKQFNISNNYQVYVNFNLCSFNDGTKIPSFEVGVENNGTFIYVYKFIYNFEIS